MTTKRIAVLAGDGIGPEVMVEATRVLAVVEENWDIDFSIQEALVGGSAYDETGHPFPKPTQEVCDQADAILFGSVGGNKWEGLPPELTPERGALLPIRQRYGLFANLRWAVVYPGLEHSSSLKFDFVEGLNLLVVRELIGGVYFAKPKELTGEMGLDTMVYSRTEVERIAHVAFREARKRGKRVTSADKQNVLDSSRLWRRVVTEVAEGYPDVACSHMYADNVAAQLVRNPKQFDVLLCGNFIGDILSDEAAQLTGSLGMLPSASLNSGTSFGLYEPGGGSAPDIAGKGIANPLAQILSVALMLRYSFGLEGAAEQIEDVVREVIADGFRTTDIMSDGCQQVSTSEMGAEVARRLN
jgi:3-isopropylmalate dehydrogenase